MLFNKDLLFLHIPKTAGMSITYYLLKVLPRPIFYAVPEGHEENLHDSEIIITPGNRHGCLLEAQEWVSQLGISLNSFKKIIAVVRNPYEMEVSRYAYLRIGHPWDRGEAQTIAMEGDFERFAIESPYHLGGKASEIYKFFMIDGKIPSNMHILRYENIQDDLTNILASLDISTYEMLPVVNQSKHTHYKKYLTAKSEQAVYNRFRWIFDAGFYQREQL